MKKKKEYILLLIVFFLFIFLSNIDNFLIDINSNLDEQKFLNDYYEKLNDDYDEIHKYHNLAIDSNINLKISKVKFRNVYDFKNEIIIYKGFIDGVFNGNAVFNNEGLVGVIKKTYEHESVVELLSNKNSEISVVINNAYGILKYDNGLIVDNLNSFENIKEGDKIYTSGIGKLPGNILVGTVDKVMLKDTKIEKIIFVSPGANLDEINYVFVYGEEND